THNLTKPQSLFSKRVLDLILIALSAPFVLPVSVLIAILVKLTSRGPVLYGHKRVGKDGRTIKCWKFRSMVVNADQMLDKILAENPEMRNEWEKDRKFTNDPRVTKLGKFLRKTSLDELPQLWNILCGEMSFVGPRPVTESELDRYGKYSNFILSVKPGLSGMWQISGRSDTGYEERVTLDTYYIQNWSVWIDIWIIIKTFWVVLKGKGAY
nr:exopolysaccharide biosynthesis polyprenyl glycosylphosphotransferase [Treponema sp.]